MIYRSLGQSNQVTEAALARIDRPLTVVRYSHRETGLPGFVRADCVIRFGKYVDEFPQWRGGDRFISFHNGYLGRDGVCVPALASYRDAARKLPLDLYGFGNDGIPCARGLASSQGQLALLQTSAAYVYVYSAPPSYTLSLLEAMLVGIPIVAPSEHMVAGTLGAVGELLGFSAARYEVPELLGYEEALLADNDQDLVRKAGCLTRNAELALASSAGLRTRARAMFDASRISLEWDRLLMAIA